MLKGKMGINIKSNPEIRPKAGARNQEQNRASGEACPQKPSGKGRYRKRVFLLRDAHGLANEILRDSKLKNEYAGIGGIHDIVKYFACRLYPKKSSLSILSERQLERLTKVIALVRSGKLKGKDIKAVREQGPPYVPMEKQIKDFQEKIPEPASQKDGDGRGNIITMATAADIQRLLNLFGEIGYSEDQRKRFINLHIGKYIDAKQIHSKAHALRLAFEIGKVKAGREKYGRRKTV